MTLKCCVAVLTIAAAGGSNASAEGGATAAAMVYGLDGAAFVIPAGSTGKRPLRRFEWLSQGTAIEAAAAARVRVAFADGTRCELLGAARAVVTDGSLAVQSGSMRQLPAVSPLPGVVIAADARPGVRSAALRLRGGRIEGLYPQGDAVVLAHAANLTFTPQPGPDRYKVQVVDEGDAPVFESIVAAGNITLPAGVLKPGAAYHWSVRSLGDAPAARGDADFTTLGADQLAARDELRRSLEGRDDADSLALLAEIDYRLGLLREAHRGFRKALDAAPQDTSLAQAIDDLERQMLGPRREY